MGCFWSRRPTTSWQASRSSSESITSPRRGKLIRVTSSERQSADQRIGIRELYSRESGRRGVHREDAAGRAWKYSINQASCGWTRCGRRDVGAMGAPVRGRMAGIGLGIAQRRGRDVSGRVSVGPGSLEPRVLYSSITSIYAIYDRLTTRGLWHGGGPPRTGYSRATGYDSCTQLYGTLSLITL